MSPIFDQMNRRVPRIPFAGAHSSAFKYGLYGKKMVYASAPSARETDIRIPALTEQAYRKLCVAFVLGTGKTENFSPGI